MFTEGLHSRSLHQVTKRKHSARNCFKAVPGLIPDYSLVRLILLPLFETTLTICGLFRRPRPPKFRSRPMTMFPISCPFLPELFFSLFLPLRRRPSLLARQCAFSSPSFFSSVCCRLTSSLRLFSRSFQRARVFSAGFLPNKNKSMFFK